MKTTALLAFALALSSAAYAQPSASKPVPSDWESVSASFFLGDKDLSLIVDRARKQALLYQHPGSAGPGVQPLRFAPYTLSAKLMKRVEAAAALSQQAPWVPLRRGDTGPAIKALQRLLNRQGEALSVDGDFGPATEAALKNYQGSYGGAQTGVVDAETRAQLRLRPRGGFYTFNDHLDARGRALTSAMRVVAQSVLARSQPKGALLNGTVQAKGKELVFVGSPGSDPARDKTYELVGATPSLERAARLLGSATVRALVWESSDPQAPRVAMIVEISVRVTDESLPSGVKAGKRVRVIGARRLSTGTQVVVVEDAQGRTGYLENPSASDSAPRTGLKDALPN